MNWEQQDHDSLTRLMEQVKTLHAWRTEMVERFNKIDTTLEAFQHRRELSRSQLVAVSSMVSAISGVLIKLFW